MASDAVKDRNPVYQIVDRRPLTLDVLGLLVFGKDEEGKDYLDLTVEVPSEIGGRAKQELRIEVEGAAHPDVDRGRDLRGACWSIRGRLRGTPNCVHVRSSDSGDCNTVQLRGLTRIEEFEQSRAGRTDGLPIINGPGTQAVIRALFHEHGVWDEVHWTWRMLGKFMVDGGARHHTTLHLNVLGMYNLRETRPLRHVLLILRDHDGVSYECDYDLKERAGTLYRMPGGYQVP